MPSSMDELTWEGLIISSLILNVKYFYDAKRYVRAQDRGKLFKCYFAFTFRATDCPNNYSNILYPIQHLNLIANISADLESAFASSFLWNKVYVNRRHHFNILIME